MIKLGNLELPPDLVIEEIFDFMAADVENTITGDEVVFLQPKNVEKAFDLVATEESGWLTRQMVEELAEMTKQVDNLVLDYHGEQMLVRFRFEDKPPIEFNAINPIADDLSKVKYYGRIKLKEV
ncbi:hypothetical protein JCM12298_10520 [Desulfothermus naphthae]